MLLGKYILDFVQLSGGKKNEITLVVKKNEITREKLKSGLWAHQNTSGAIFWHTPSFLHYKKNFKIFFRSRQKFLSLSSHFFSNFFKILRKRILELSNRKMNVIYGFYAQFYPKLSFFGHYPPLGGPPYPGVR